jgi:hypothetical protein
MDQHVGPRYVPQVHSGHILLHGGLHLFGCSNDQIMTDLEKPFIIFDD